MTRALDIANLVFMTNAECLSCNARFEELPFYGCCLPCYLASADTRALVDGAHPATQSTPDGFYVVAGGQS